MVFRRNDDGKLTLNWKTAKWVIMVVFFAGTAWASLATFATREFVKDEDQKMQQINREMHEKDRDRLDQKLDRIDDKLDKIIERQRRK